MEELGEKAIRPKSDRRRLVVTLAFIFLRQLCHNIVMIDFATESELKEVLKEYNVPELIFDSRKGAGPDEEIYLYHDMDGNNFILWSRDYMSELFYEARGLENEFNINVVKWIELKDGGSYDPKYPDEDDKKIFEAKGMRYALGLIDK